MTERTALERPPSLVGITIRRAAVAGRMYLTIGTGVSLVYTVALSLASTTAFESAFPLLLPVFGVLGGLGGMMVFTSDRVKGVLEYLLAYGMSPRRLFLDILLASLVLLTIVLGVSLGVGLGIFLGKGNSISLPFAEELLLYAIPMSYASAAFASTVGMFWSSLSSPREGMNSPLGLMPLIGIAPSLLTLISYSVIAASHPVPFFEVAGVALLVVLLLVLVLMSQVGRLLAAERLLSPT